jgi:hypothetical protein
MIPLNRTAYGIFSIGEKGTTGLTRPFPDLLIQAITQIAIPINFPTAASIAHQVVTAS